MNINNIPWTERHRPETLDEVVGNEDAIGVMKDWVDDETVPNLLLIGSAGVGKTTAATAFAREVFGDDWRANFIEMNASDDRGIDVVRNQIKPQAQQASAGDYPYKVLFLDEADSLCLPPGTEVITGYPSQPVLKPIEEVSETGEKIPSVNFETNEIQSDEGRLIDSGTADFYTVQLEDGREVTASPEHPFFVVGTDRQLEEKRLEELESGDKIADFRNDIGVSRCLRCSKWTKNPKYCSPKCHLNHDHPKEVDNVPVECEWCGTVEEYLPCVAKTRRFCKQECKDNAHSSEMTGEQNPMYGVAWGDDRRQKIVSKLSDGRLEGENNPHYKDGVGIYRKIVGLDDKEEAQCEVCENTVKVGGRDGIYVHHRDRDQRNNDPENLMLVCPKCHQTKVHKNTLDPGESQEDITGEILIEDGGRNPVDTVAVESVEFSHTGRAYNITMEGTPNFMLSNGILTHNTKDSMAALRRVMEDNTDNTRFFLSCNFVNKIIDPIQSRCAPLRFSPLDTSEMMTVLERVADREDVDYDRDALEMVAEYAEGDARRGIYTLQMASMGDDMTMSDVQGMVSTVNEDNLREIVELAMGGDIDTAQERLNVEFLKEGVDPSTLADGLHRVLRDVDFPEDVHYKVALDKLGECEWRCMRGANPHIHFNSLLADLTVARYASLQPYQDDG